jgi:hypothetical protein
MDLVNHLPNIGYFNMQQCNSVDWHGVIKLLKNEKLAIELQSDTTIGSVNIMLKLFDKIKEFDESRLSMMPKFMRYLNFSSWPISSNDIKILSKS